MVLLAIIVDLVLVPSYMISGLVFAAVFLVAAVSLFRSARKPDRDLPSGPEAPPRG